jgi:hypothetical protein
MLRRNEGASRPLIAKTTGWEQHTVCGVLAGLAAGYRDFTALINDRRTVAPLCFT